MQSHSPGSGESLAMGGGRWGQVSWGEGREGSPVLRAGSMLRRCISWVPLPSVGRAFLVLSFAGALLGPAGLSLASRAIHSPTPCQHFKLVGAAALQASSLVCIDSVLPQLPTKLGLGLSPLHCITREERSGRPPPPPPPPPSRVVFSNNTLVQRQSNCPGQAGLGFASCRL